VTSALKELFANSGTMQEYKKNYYVADRGEQDLELILDTAERLGRTQELTEKLLEKALSMLISAGEFPRKQAPARYGALRGFSRKPG
jgi:hypothetical protein